MKIQRFTNLPPEVTVVRVSMNEDAERYQRAYENGAEHCFSKRVGGTRVNTGKEASEEDLERARRRAKAQVRKLVKELVPNHFSTFSTREAGPTYYTASDWREMWKHFLRALKRHGIKFRYVAVLERHPSNPEHLHLHVAWRGEGFVNYNVLRRLWQWAIGKFAGFEVKRLLKGKDSPGNIQDKYIRATAGGYAHAKKIGKYIGKYITKDLISEFNKKRYWQSNTIRLSPPEVRWLVGLTIQDALREALEPLGLWGEFGPAQRVYCPDERIAWLEMDAEFWKRPDTA